MRRGKKIALDVAFGLLHLHRGQIVHLNIASNNVVLDQGWIGKISEFGYSRMLHHELDAASLAAFGPSIYTPPESVRAGLLIEFSLPVIHCPLQILHCACASFQQACKSLCPWQSVTIELSYKT
jgi:serine/threonine protein kinase